MIAIRLYFLSTIVVGIADQLALGPVGELKRRKELVALTRSVALLSRPTSSRQAVTTSHSAHLYHLISPEPPVLQGQSIKPRQPTPIPSPSIHIIIEHRKDLQDHSPTIRATYELSRSVAIWTTKEDPSANPRQGPHHPHPSWRPQHRQGGRHRAPAPRPSRRASRVLRST